MPQTDNEIVFEFSSLEQAKKGINVVVLLYWKTSETSYNAICFPLFPVISTLQK